MVSGANVGTVYLRDGQIVHAEAGTECGNDALVEIVSWGEMKAAPTARAASPVLKRLVRRRCIAPRCAGRRKASRPPAWRQQTG